MKLGVLVTYFNPSLREAKAKKSLNFRPARAKYKILSQKNKQKIEKLTS
jgi:hypothetical protein